MDETSVAAAASRRSTRKRKTTREKYSPPPLNRKKMSDVYQIVATTDNGLMQNRDKERSEEHNEAQKKSKKAITKEDSENAVASDIEEDSGNFDTSSISEFEDEDDIPPPQLYSVLPLPSERKSIEKESSCKDVEPLTAVATVKSQVYEQKDPAESLSQVVKAVENKPAERPEFNDSLIQESIVALKKLNPELFAFALKKPIQEGDTLIVAIKLLESLSTPSTSDTVVSFLQDAENVSKKFFKDFLLPLQKSRINLEKAWEAIAVTYGLFGPTVVPIILHFIKQQNLLETKYSKNPAALFSYTLMIVKLFHESLFPLLSPQITITHSWILGILEQPVLRSYLTLVQWIRYFEPRLSPIFICDPSIEPYKIVTEFMNKFVYDPYSFFCTELKRLPLFLNNQIFILLPQTSLKDDKLSLIALLFRGLENIGCGIKLCAIENNIAKEYESIKASNPKCFIFASEVSLQQAHSSPSFGSLCFSFNFGLKSLELLKHGRPSKLQISATNFDGNIINEDSLVNNNITPACICRYYLEHITKFIESFIKEEQQ